MDPVRGTFPTGKIQRRETSQSLRSVRLEPLSQQPSTGYFSRNNTNAPTGPGPPGISREPTFLGLTSQTGTKTQLVLKNKSNSKIPLTLTTSRLVLPKLVDNEDEIDDGEADDDTGSDVGSGDENNNKVSALAREFTRQFTFANYSISRDVTKLAARKDDHVTSEKKLYAKCYEDACRKLRVPPVALITRSLSEPVMGLRRYCLGERGTRSLAIALVNNKRVMSLDLTDNWLSSTGAKIIADMLKANTHITHLNLSENGIGSVGAQAICGAVALSPAVNRLNLSHNGLRDIDSKFIRNLLKTNKTLRNLDISNNEFREGGGIIIGDAIQFNATLTELNISWNHLRGKGALGLCLGLQGNVGIKTLDVSWNGFGMQGAEALGKMLMENTSIRSLDVTCNRLDADAIKPFLKGLVKNATLNTLKISRNSFPTKVATAILTAILESPTLPLTELDMQDVVVDGEFVNLLDEVSRSYRSLNVNHGPVMRVNEGATKGESNVMSTTPLTVFFETMNTKGLRIQDLYKRYDTGQRDEFIITPQQFRDGIISIQVPLNGGAIEQIIEKIRNKRGNPDLIKLMEEEKKHRKKLLKVRMRMAQKRNRKPKPKTEDN